TAAPSSTPRARRRTSAECNGRSTAAAGTTGKPPGQLWPHARSSPKCSGRSPRHTRSLSANARGVERRLRNQAVGEARGVALHHDLAGADTEDLQVGAARGIGLQPPVDRLGREGGAEV